MPIVNYVRTVMNQSVNFAACPLANTGSGQMSEPNCPVCGFPLEAIPHWNPDIIPIGPENPIESYICNNPDCHGWYDEYCETWRSFGSSCSVCAVRNTRSNTNYQSDDWRGYELYQKLHSSINENRRRTA